MPNKVEIVVEVNSKTGEARIKGLGDSMERTGRKGKRGFDLAGRGLSRLNAKLDGTHGRLTRLVATVGFAAGARKILQTADQYQLLADRIGLVTDSEQERLRVGRELFDISKRTRTEYSGTLNLYARMARSAEELNVSQEDLLQMTETINQSMLVSGATTQEASAAMIQFSQAMASGQLRGEELRSVMEQTPRLSKAIADGLDVPIGKLREMAEAGELTTDKVINALLGQKHVIADEYSKMSATVGQAMNVLGNSLGGLVHRTNESGHATNILADGILDVADSIDTWADKNEELIAQKVPEYIDKTRDSVQSIVDIYNSLPDGVVGAAGTGLLASILTGSPWVGIAAALADYFDLIDKVQQHRKELNASMHDYETMPLSFFEDELGPMPDAEEADRLKDWMAQRKALIQEMLRQDAEQTNYPMLNIGPAKITDSGEGSAPVPVPEWESNKNYYKEANEQWKEHNKLVAEADAIYRDVRTPAEEYAATVEWLNYLYDNAGLSQETLNRGLAAAADEYDKTMKQMEESTWSLNEFQIQAYRNMQSAGGEFFKSIREGNEDVLDSFINMTQRMVDEWLSAQLMMAAFGQDFGSGGPLGGFLGTALSYGVAYAGGMPPFNSPGSAITGNYGPMPGFADGGSFMVGGSGGTDSQPVQFWATPGERVDITTPAQQRSSGSKEININLGPVTIVAADSKSFDDMGKRNPQTFLRPIREAIENGDTGLIALLREVLQ